MQKYSEMSDTLLYKPNYNIPEGTDLTFNVSEWTLDLSYCYKCVCDHFNVIELQGNPP